METICYRGMPKSVGAFFDALYQHPTLMLLFIAGVTVAAGTWWYKANQKPE
ncbi:hypothetical protein [Methylomonas sp. MgM2]